MPIVAASGGRMTALTYLVGRHNSWDSPWTDELVERLKVLWAEGLSASQIADELKGANLTRMSVIGKVHRLNLPARKTRTSHRRASVPKPPAPPPKPAPPLPPPPPLPGAPTMRRLQLVALQSFHCRWPVGDVGAPDFFFCAADAHGEIYCPFHMRAARVRERRS